jgi:hypothetical protein
VPCLTENLKKNLASVINQIKPQNMLELWPLLLSPENFMYFQNEI